MTTTATEVGIPPQTRRALTALIVGAMAAVLDTTIVSIALATLVTDLHASVSQIQWVSTGYLLALGVVIPLAGWGQARFGGKRLWMFALTLFVTGSVLCAASWNAQSLIAFRVVQGLGAGLIFPLMMTLAMAAARAAGLGSGSSSLGRITATVSLPIALGPIFGPVLGGVILNWFDWRWLFLVNVPVVAVGLWLAWRNVPDDTPDDAPAADGASAARPALDLLGLALIVPALAGVLLGLSDVHRSGGFGRPDVLVPLVGGLALVVLFVLRAVRVEHPLIDVRLLTVRSVGASAAALFLTGACMYAAMFLLPLYWQNLRGFSVLSAALLLIPQGVGSLATRVVAGRLTDEVGARVVAIGGFVLIALTTVPFAFASATTNEWYLGGVLLLRGLGLGVVLIPVMTVAFHDIGPSDIPHASMITRISQQVGGSFGVAVAAVVLQSALAGNDNPAGAFDQAFWWTIGFTMLAALGSVLLPSRPQAPEPVAARA